MAISEQARHEPYRRLGDLLGGEAATTLMEHPPPVGSNLSIAGVAFAAAGLR